MVSWVTSASLVLSLLAISTAHSSASEVGNLIDCFPFRYSTKAFVLCHLDNNATLVAGNTSSLKTVSAEALKVYKKVDSSVQQVLKDAGIQLKLAKLARKDAKLIKKELAEIGSDVADTKEHLKTAEKDAAKIGQHVAATQKDASSLQKEVPAMEKQLTAVEKDVGAVKTDVTATQKEVGAVEAAVTKLRKNLAAVEASMVKLEKDADEMVIECNHTNPSNECPSTFVKSGNSCYHLVSMRLEWSIAGIHCRTLHPDAHLAVANSVKEQKDIERVLHPSPKIAPAVDKVHLDHWWIAGQRYLPHHQSSPFVWRLLSTHSGNDQVIEMKYHHWGPGEPSLTGLKSCVQFDINTPYMWFAQNCNETAGAICQIDLPHYH